MTARTSYVYVGLAGETAPGHPVQSGFHRIAFGDDRWELSTKGLPLWSDGETSARVSKAFDGARIGCVPHPALEADTVFHTGR